MRKNQITLLLLFNSVPGFLIRVVILNLLILFSVITFFVELIPVSVPLFFVSIFAIVEVFFRYGVGYLLPEKSVSENSGDVLDSFTKDALLCIANTNRIDIFIKRLLKFEQAQFILIKTAIGQKELTNSNLVLNEVIKKAFEISKNNSGAFVTTGDLLSSYLLLTESESKLMFSKKLKENDLLSINKWARISIYEEETIDRKAKFTGLGFGEALVYGWTPETKKYTKDHTLQHIRKKPLIEGRESEYKQIIDAMQKPKNNNVLLVGEIGTGKNNLVENYIYESYSAVLPSKLNHRRFLELMIGPLIAGAGGREDLETRIQSVIEEIKHSINIVLFVPEFQNLLGSSSYKLDLSGAILPYLKDGKMPIIATMRKGEYKKFFENSALKEVFEVIVLEEPNLDVALKMLFEKTQEIESENNVNLSYSAVVAAVKYADKFEPGVQLPGTAVDLLNTVANDARIAKGSGATVMEEEVLRAIEVKSKIPVGAPSKKEKETLLNLEKEMHKSVIGQDEAISQVSEALRRIRAGLSREKPISFLFLGPTGVGKTETAKTLARLYFEGEKHIIRVDMSEYGTSDSLNRLINSDSGSFLDQVASHPFSLILLDEFEKADSKILNLFLQVFDDGRMTDNNGKTISFTDTIIISTSNAGSEFIRQKVGKDEELSNKALLNYLQEIGIYTPELLNRFDAVVTFKPLTQTEIVSVASLVINELKSKLSQQDVELNVDEKAIKHIAKEGYDQEFGARPLRRYLQNNIEDVVAKKILADEFQRGDVVNVTLDQSSNLVISK